MKKLNYVKPQFDVIEVESNDIIAASCVGVDAGCASDCPGNCAMV